MEEYKGYSIEVITDYLGYNFSNKSVRVYKDNKIKLTYKDFFNWTKEDIVKYAKHKIDESVAGGVYVSQKH